MSVVSWVLLALVISTLIARFAVKFSRRTNKKLFAPDDIFLLLAAVFSFGQTVAVSIQWKDASGQQLPNTSLGNGAIYQKTAYVSSIMFIANMGCAKISISLLIRKLFTGRLFEYTSIILALFTSGWTISGILVTAFQCRLPNPWDILKRDHCIDIAAFGNFLASINIATEVLLVLVPLAVWTRGTSVGNRLYVSATFFSRLSIIAAVSAQLYYFNASTSSSPTPDSWNTTLCMQIAQTLSVASACLPGLHPLVAKDMSCTASSLYAQTDPAKRWDVKKFGSLSSHSSHPSTDPSAAFEPVTSPYCRPLATHGLVRSPPSCDAYFSPLVFASTTPAAPNNVFNRLVGASDAPSTSPFIDQDPLGIPNNAHQLGYLPSTPDWEEDEESGTTRPQRRPSSDYVFYRSKVISVAEGGLLGAGEEGRRFVPPLPSPRMGRGARTF